MGTSASYSAPPSWGDLKRAVTVAVRGGTLSPKKAGKLVGSFIEHNGGAAAIARGGGGSVAKGGNARGTAGRLGSFVGDVARLGLTGALEAAGWGDLAGKTVREILNGLLDRLGGESSTIDDVDARMALAELEKQYFDQAKTSEELEQLMVAQVGQVEELLQDYFSLYLYEVFCRVFFERLVQRVGETRAYAVLGQIKDFIVAKLENLAADRDLSTVNWKGTDGERITTEVMEATLRVFE